MNKFALFILLMFPALNLRAQTPEDSLMDTYNLKEVCVNALNERDRNQSFNFYKSNKLASTEDILSRMQGVNLIRRGAFGLEPTLRNFGTGQTNLTIDGMRMYGACTDKMDPVSIYIEPQNLHSIDVANGAAGAQDGSTVGGQIRMNLNEPFFHCHSRLFGSVSQSYHSVNQGFHNSLVLQRSQGNIAYRVSGTARSAGLYRAGGGEIIQHSGFKKYNVSGSFIWKADSFHDIKLDYIGDWGRNIGYPALPMDVGIANAHIFSITLRSRYQATSRLKNSELKVYGNDIVHYMDDTHRENIPMHMDMPGWSRTLGFYSKFTTRKNFNFRIDYHRAYTRADMIMYPVNEAQMYMQTLPENILHNAGFSFSRKFELAAKQNLLLNGRADFYRQMAVSGFGAEQWKVFQTDATEAKINILKNLNLAYQNQRWKVMNIKYSIGYSERIPTSNERYGYYLFNRQDQYDYVGNLNLKPEQSFQTELDFSRKFDRININVTLFSHYIKNYIYAYRLEGMSQMTIGAYGLKSYKNIDYAINTGGEAVISAKISKDIHYMGSFKYVYGQTFEHLPIALTPPFKSQQALRYEFKWVQIQAEYDAAAGQRRVNFDFGDRVTPSWHLFNLRLSGKHDIRETRVQWSVACENIFDIRYREHLDIGQIPRFGRNILLNLGWVF